MLPEPPLVDPLAGAEVDEEEEPVLELDVSFLESPELAVPFLLEL